MILTGTPNNFAAASASSCSVSRVECSSKIVKRTSPLCGDVLTLQFGEHLFQFHYISVD